jgi:hypothetical protein
VLLPALENIDDRLEHLLNIVVVVVVVYSLIVCNLSGIITTVHGNGDPPLALI